jgi:hypothetical protein
MSVWDFNGDAEFDRGSPELDSGNGTDNTEAGESVGQAGSPAPPPPLAFREPEPHEQVPGQHLAYSAETQWCRACTERYAAPILWPCATHDYQEARSQFEREQPSCSGGPQPFSGTSPSTGADNHAAEPPGISS